MSSKREKSRSQPTINVLDLVALLLALPDEGLVCGQVGTVVEELGSEIYEVESSDDEGRTYAQMALRSDQLMGLLHRPVEAA